MIADALAVVISGGDSRRMGRDKATLVLGDRTLLAHVIAAVQPLFAEVLVSVRHPRADIEWPQISDRFADAGPLAGIGAGLEYAAERGVPWVFAVAADMPLMQPALIDFLAARRSGWQAVVPVVQEYPQALAGFYATDALPAVRAVLADSGRRSVRAALERLRANYVGESELRAANFDPQCFFDLDTPDDLMAAQRRGGYC